MRPTRFVITGVLVASASAVIMLAGRPAQTQGVTACDCPDVFDLINRLNMAETAVGALNEQISKIEQADKDAGKTSMMDEVNAKGQSNYEMVKAAALDALASNQMRGSEIAAGHTEFGIAGACTSSLTAKSKSSCINEVVLHHEDTVHVPACKKDVAAGKTAALGGRAPLTTLAYVREEIAGYQSEVDYIRERLRSLPASCRPKGWFGMIYYHELSTMNSEHALTPGGNLVAGKEGGEHSLMRETRILYRETDKSTANVHVLETSSQFSDKTARWGCTGGFRQGPLQTTDFKHRENRRNEAYKDGELDVAFQYDAATGEYALGFLILSAGGEGAVTISDETQNDCDPKNNGTKTTAPAQYSMMFDGGQVSVSGQATRGLDRLQGQRDVPTGPSTTGPGFSSTNTASIRWVFYRVD